MFRRVNNSQGSLESVSQHDWGAGEKRQLLAGGEWLPRVPVSKGRLRWRHHANR